MIYGQSGLLNNLIYLENKKYVLNSYMLIYILINGSYPSCTYIFMGFYFFGKYKTLTYFLDI